ncbi:MAG: hypothetical protein L0Z62_23110 [Gemmataceae bacterium]|nr:hypothetical protein [Gemmataceae bacterium]
MSAVTAERVPSVAPGGATRPAAGWLVGPWFDALLIANIAWPLLVLMQLGDGFSGHDGLHFWQLYFVTTPHRWITLLIVFLDRERFHQRRGVFLGLAVCAVVVCLGVRFTTGALTCLMTIGYLWDAWHFASQHHGIYRIYSRLDDPARTTGLALEKWALRGFLLYVILRVALMTSPHATAQFWQTCDWLVAVVPVWLVLRDVTRARPTSAGRLVYLLSVSGLYLSLLWAVHERRLGLALVLTTASALFHALEYLALVSWSVRQRHAARGSQMGVLAHLVPRWGLALGVFALVLGAGAWFMDQRFFEVWLTINVIVAFLHYAYDGLIWRRQPAR